MEDPFYAIVPTHYPFTKKKVITQTELVEYPFLMAPMNTLQKLLTVIPTNQIDVNCDDDDTLISMVSEGLGVTVLPTLSLHHVPENIAVLSLTPPITRTIGIALPANPSRAALDFADYLIKSHRH